MEVLKLYIHVNGCEKVESECATVQMISFDGRCDGDTLSHDGRRKYASVRGKRGKNRSNRR